MISIICWLIRMLLIARFGWPSRAAGRPEVQRAAGWKLVLTVGSFVIGVAVVKWQ